MPRQARIDAPNALHHIIARGIERGKIFQDDADCEGFLRRLGNLIEQTETRCHAWALMPNHFHLLLKTGTVPIATVMGRLLTGYAVGYNRRHRRSGHLFQNRYKSILCQEDAYLKELVRYIHLNPLRAGLVGDLQALDRYPYAGHSVIMGRNRREWQTTGAVLALFSGDASQARRMYHDFVAAGIPLGRQPELIGGGLIRSTGGWEGVKMLRNEGRSQKSDERILGNGDFVKSVLADAEESMARHDALKAKGISLDRLQQIVASLTMIRPEELVGPAKARNVGRARALFCYWAVRKLGHSMTDVAKRLEISLPTVSVAVPKGERIVRDAGWGLEEHLNVKI
ncbi:MAG: transposase [Deltaproteobacteria bacterium]|nr:transposase [Deltaproteobacteria bacterium]